MFKKFIYFIQYNNFTIILILVFFIIGTGVFAQTETGQNIIGSEKKAIEGVDNTLLLEAELDNFDMNYKIESIEEDDNYYYVTYTYLDLVKQNQAWQYQIQENGRKVSKKLKTDLGEYLGEELSEQYEARIKELKKEQVSAKEQGDTKRVEVTEYDGLIGQTLAVAGRIFSNYEPIKKHKLPTPTLPSMLTTPRSDQEQKVSVADNLTDIYNDYIEENDADHDNVFKRFDNCPDIYNPEQEDSDNDGVGDACDDVDNSQENVINPETIDKDTASTEPDVILDNEEPAVENNPVQDSEQVTEGVSGDVEPGNNVGSNETGTNEATSAPTSDPANNPELNVEIVEPFDEASTSPDETKKPQSEESNSSE